MESRFRSALRTQEAKEVSMNSFDGIVFKHKPCIGTDNLKGCNTVIIVSAKAAIMGHNAPRPESSAYEHAGDTHTELFMDRLLNYQWTYEPYFPPNPNALVICATFLGAVALPDQQKIMVEKMNEKDFQVETEYTYEVSPAATSPNRGSCFVDSRGQKIVVYVEDKAVLEIDKTTEEVYIWSNNNNNNWIKRPSGAPAALPAPIAVPANTQWDGLYHVSIANPAYIWSNNTWVKRPSAAPASNQASGWLWSSQYKRHYRTLSDGSTEWSEPSSSS
jgi:hypothetical protein